MTKQMQLLFFYVYWKEVKAKKSIKLSAKP